MRGNAEFLVVVETADAILAAVSVQVQDVKADSRPHQVRTGTKPPTTARCTGRRDTSRFRRSRRTLPGERIVVKPGARLSLRAESPPCRTLGRRARHGARHARHRDVHPRRKRIDLHPHSACSTGSKTWARCRSKSSRFESGHVSRRRRHRCVFRRQVRPVNKKMSGCGAPCTAWTSSLGLWIGCAGKS